jgi:predicted nuclease of predicted toxin-antitoxin system
VTSEVGAERPVCWDDAKLPPALADWLREWGTTAVHVSALRLLTATDREIFDAARAANAIVITKDEDFVRLLESHGPPPSIVWVRVGNVRNANLNAIFSRHWESVSAQVAAGEPLVEIPDSSKA